RALRDSHSFPTRRSSDLTHGNFDLGGTARGSYVVSAIAPNRATATSAVIQVDGDVNGIVVRVLADRRIVGRALHHDRSPASDARSEEHTSELQSRENLVC